MTDPVVAERGRRPALVAGLLALVAAIVVLAVIVPGGGDDEPASAPGTTTAGARTSGPAGTAATVDLAAPVRTIEGDLVGAKVRLDAQPLVRSGATTVLTVVLTVVAEGEGGPVNIGDSFTARGDAGTLRNSLSDVALFAPEQRVLAFPAALAGGRPATSSTSPGVAFRQGDSAGLRVVFAALAPDVRQADVLWPLFGVIAGLPVGEGPIPELPPYGDSPARDVEMAGITGVAQAVTARSSQLEGAVRVEQAPDRTKVVLAADVLFALDSADLSDQAKAALDRAAAEVQASGPGSVRVTGHTDDQGSDQYNVDLSNRRAQAVAAALAPQLPPARYPPEVVGRGESEPAVPGATAEARAANRRVELLAERAESAGPAPVASALPPGGGPAATGATGLAFDQSDGSRLRLRAERAVRAGAWLRVDLAATVEQGGRQLGTAQFLVDLRDVTRGLKSADASGVGVLDGAVLRLPAVVADGRCACANTLFGLSARKGDVRRLSVWVESPANLGPAVVVQLPLGQGRLTDVPVER